MKTIFFGVLAALTFATLPAAYAADDASVQIKGAPSNYHMRQSEFAEYENWYQLSNGQILKFTQDQSHFYAQLDKGERVTIYATAKGQFVSNAGTRFAFSDEANSVGVEHFGRLPRAKATGATLVMARR